MNRIQSLWIRTQFAVAAYREMQGRPDKEIDVMVFWIEKRQVKQRHEEMLREARNLHLARRLRSERRERRAERQ
ncbi:MAG: hypothetical protein OXF83_11345 [Anaerolineaceae bacterium]|nr:hypothetical protein [Anaerolineaceae bacterium]